MGKVRAQLEKTGCPILGMVLNKVNVKKDKKYGKIQKNWGNIEYKKHLGDMAYLILFLLITFDKMLGTTMIGSRYPRL